MTAAGLILGAIADLTAADPFGTAQPIDVAKRLRINIGALARAVPELQRAGLIEIDEDAGTLTLTDAGRVKTEDAGAIGIAPQPAPERPMPDMTISVYRPSTATEAPRTEPVIGAPAIEPPTVEPAVGQLDLIPAPRRPVASAGSKARSASKVKVAPKRAGLKGKKPAKRR